jgi:hypothetical protein
MMRWGAAVALSVLLAGCRSPSPDLPKAVATPKPAVTTQPTSPQTSTTQAADRRHFAGFPVYPRIANADSADRHDLTFRVPTHLRISRTDTQIFIELDPDTVETVSVSVGKNMVFGMQDESRVLRGENEVVSGIGGLTSFGPDVTPNLGTSILNRSLDHVPNPGEHYTVECKVELFETDLPAQHIWMPQGKKFRVVWTRTIRQEVN